MERGEPSVGNESGDSSAPRWRRPGAIAAFSVLALLVGVFGVSLVTAGRALPANPSGSRAPDFTLPLLDRPGSLSLSSIRGRPIVLNFWASW